MKNATIHQPYFLPWIGYFTKLAHSDVFIVLDDVNFRDRFYQKRAQFLNTNNKKKYLSLKVGHNYNIKLNNVTFDFEKDKFIRKSLITLEQAYSKYQHFEKEWTDFRDVFRLIIRENNRLLDINIKFIEYFLEILNIRDLEIVYSSQFLNKKKYTPTERYIALCNRGKINTIITGSGKSLNVHNLNLLIENDINIKIQYYNSIKSKFSHQLPDIDLNLSIIHYLFRIGRLELERVIKHTDFEPRLFKYEGY